MTGNNTSLSSLLSQHQLSLHARICRYDGNIPCEVEAHWLEAMEEDFALQLEHSRWDLHWQSREIANGVFECRLKAVLERGAMPNGSVDLMLEDTAWNVDHYVFSPAALYNGNRYRSIPSHRRSDLPDAGPDMPVTIGNIPRLNIAEGQSCVQLLSGDCTTPAIGYAAIQRQWGMFWLTPQQTEAGNTGLSIFESDDRRSARLMLRAPGVREQVRYNGRPSLDRGMLAMPGDEITLSCLIVTFQPERIADLFEQFMLWRNYYRLTPYLRHEIPFSATWQIQEDKYNRQNWVEEYGYYSVGMRESPAQDWQTGWVGGPNAAYALFAEGSPVTRQRALRIFDFLCDSGGIAPNGFLRGCFHRGQWHDDKGLFMRYQADSLYFLCKMLLLASARDSTFRPKEHWLGLIRGLAGAFCEVWERHRRMPQFVYPDSFEIWLNGTAAGALAPGGLCLAARLLGNEKYREVATQIGEYYYHAHVSTGELNGGPGDILQAIDSESAAAMLESFLTLFEETAQPVWLRYAEETAWQCASWVTSYDYEFPPESTFAKLKMSTLGTVFANVQNKHSAPGLCSLSGVAFLKLFRGTGRYDYLQLIAEIAHAIGQYMSREDRPICDRRANKPWPVMDPGWINERVNMSDWEVRGEPHEEIGVGEIFGGSTWAEVAMLLTRAELPGIYLQPDAGRVCCLDHIEATPLKSTPDAMTLRIHNPTRFPASVKVLCENSAQTAIPLGPIPGVDLPQISLAPGQSEVFTFAT